MDAEKTAGQEWYAEYLQTPHWKKTRARKLQAAGYRCSRCAAPAIEMEGAWFGLVVHHLTYERVGCEEPNDLVVLCKPCHSTEHGFEIDPDETWREARIRATRRYIGLSAYGVYIDDIDEEVKAWDSLAEAAGV